MKQAIMQMIDDITEHQSASREEIAAFIGKTKTQFDNCLYQTNGQQFKAHDLLAIQSRYRVQHFTNWICEQTGGVFVEARSKSDLDKIELFDLMLAEQSASADLTAFYAKALEDGVITQKEYEKMHKKHMRVFQARSDRLAASYAVFGK